MIYALLTNNIVTNIIVSDPGFIESQVGTGMYDKYFEYTTTDWYPSPGYIYNGDGIAQDSSQFTNPNQNQD
jgi:hypothetical protein